MRTYMVKVCRWNSLFLILFMVASCQTKPEKSKNKVEETTASSSKDKVLEKTKIPAPFSYLVSAQNYMQEKSFEKACESYSQSLKSSYSDYLYGAIKSKIIECYRLMNNDKDRSDFAGSFEFLIKNSKPTEYAQIKADKSWDILELSKVLEEKSSVIEAKKQLSNTLNWNPQTWKKDDPFLENLLEESCSFPKQAKALADKAVPRPEPKQLEFLDIYVDYCKKNYNLAKERIKTFLFSLKRTEPNYKLHTLRSATLLVQINRVNGLSREDIANSYFFEMLAYDKFEASDLKPFSNKEEFWLERANRAIWTARYRALVGDYFHGEFFINEAQSILNNDLKPYRLSDEQKEEHMELLAESYHVLAFRISVEKNNLNESILNTKKALAIKNLSAKWEQTLLWYLGLYYYLSDDFNQAISSWETLLSSCEMSSYHPGVYFWLNKAFSKINQQKLAKKYLDLLNEEFPLDYYTMVASCEENIAYCAGALTKKEVTPSFDSYLPLIKERLTEADKLSSYDLKEFSVGSLKDLYKYVKARYPVDVHLDVYRSIQKSFKKSGSYIMAIRMSGLINRHISSAEKTTYNNLSLAYPMPYPEIYKKYGKQLGKDGAQILYAISRQESGFIEDVESSAGAVGLMQIIPPLAKKLLKRPDLSYRDVAKLLKSPEKNVSLGAMNLKNLYDKYDGKYAAIAGAYNAGEYLIDIWLQRRKNKDLLLWVELVPFYETRNYIKKTWRNLLIYKKLSSKPSDRLENKGDIK